MVHSVFPEPFAQYSDPIIQNIPKDIAAYAVPPINVTLFQAKARKGLTFDQLAKEIGKDEVWLAAAFYGQVRHPVHCVSFQVTNI